MARLQERYRVWAEREGLVEVGHLPMRLAQRAVSRSLRTMDKAVALFDRVEAHLGEGAWIDPEGGGTRRRLYVRDADHPDWLLPVALLEHAWIPDLGRQTIASFYNSGAVKAEDEPEDWTPEDGPWWEVDPEPEILPQNEHMRSGSLKLAEGPGHVELKYDTRGLFYESCWSASGDTFSYARSFNVRPFIIDPLARPPSPMPFSLACRADLRAEGHDLDEFVDMVLALDPARLLPGRVLLPLPMPGGVTGAWTRGKWALREACFDGRIPDDATGWVVVDAFEGTALAVGTDFEDAVARWREVVEEVRPRPPGDPAPLPPLDPADEEAPKVHRDEDGRFRGFSTGTVHLESPALAELAWPLPLPRYVPAVALPLPPLPAIPARFRAAGFERVLRMIGEHGAVTHGLLRQEADGFTVVGEGLLDVIDPATLEAEIAAARAQQRADYADLPEGFQNPFDQDHPAQIWQFRAWDDARRQRKPLEFAGASFGAFSPRNIAGDQWPWQVVRVWRSPDDGATEEGPAQPR